MLLKTIVKARGMQSIRLRPTVSHDFTKNAANARVMYIHIPFCHNLCPFCSFHRFQYEPSTADKYFTALRKELSLYHERGLDFDEFYFGGGTPTIDMEQLERTILFIRDNFTARKFSVETNPADLSEKGISSLKKMRIDRLSVGVQSLDEHTLKNMERYECFGAPDRIKERLSNAIPEFPVLNVDMMFNIDGQTINELSSDIDSLLELGLEQITYYPLMNAHGTKGIINRWRRNDYQREKQFYYEIYKRISPHMEAQTVWCFSKTSEMLDEYIIDHGTYFGAGCGSFAYIDGSLLANTFSLDKYIHTVSNSNLPLSFVNSFTPKEQMRYDLLMQLFRKNIDIKKYNEKYMGKFGKMLWHDIQFLKHIQAIRMSEHTAHLTRKGMYYLLVMMREFFQVVGAYRAQCQIMS